MKILCICYENMAGFIGGVRQVTKIADGLINLGHNIEICVPLIGKYKGMTESKLSYIPVVNYKFLRPLTYNISAPIYILLRCLNFKPDCLLTYEIFFSPAPLIISKIFSLPYILFINGGLEDFKLHGCPRSVLRYIEILRKINIRSAYRIITVTQSLKEELSKDYGVMPEKITVVNNGVDTTEFKPMDKRDCCRQLGLNSDIRYVGFLGGIYQWHGLENLVKSANYVVKEYPNVKYIIAGHGPMREVLIDLTKQLDIYDYFLFPGEIPFESVPVWMNSFDIGVIFFKQVRKNQGNPIKLYEYLACGKPVIASKVQGYGDFVERTGAGISVNSESPENISSAIIRLLKNPDLINKMGTLAREIVTREYTWTKTAKNVEEVLRL